MASARRLARMVVILAWERDVTLKIEVGKYYRTRDGRKVGPMALGKDADETSYPWTNLGQNELGRWSCDGEDGETCMAGETDGDLIAEWRDQPAHIITHNGRDYDLTALETPFGLLPEPVREALKAWPHGVEIFGQQTCAWVNIRSLSFMPFMAYRAKPAPVEVRIRCWRGCYEQGAIEIGTCVKRADGSLDWSTWESSE